MGPVPAEPERPSLYQVFWPQIWSFDAILVTFGEHIAHIDLFVVCCGLGKGLIGEDFSHQLWARRLPPDRRRLTSPGSIPNTGARTGQHPFWS